MHPSATAILAYFDCDHMSSYLRKYAEPFRTLAHSMAANLEGPELTVCLRKLLESKDCAVRAALDAKATAIVAALDLKEN